MNIASLLERAGRSFGERPAISTGSRIHASYGALARRAGTIASNLRKQFVLAPGDRVALAMKNSPQYIEVLFGCWHAGLIVVPVNAKLAAKEFEYHLQHSGARICFVTEDLLDVMDRVKSSVGSLQAVIPVQGEAYGTLVRGEPISMVHRAPTDTAWLFYTSGTTGRPKGAMLSHRALLAMTSGYFVDVDRIGPSDSIIHAAPMSHGSGMYILPHVAAAANQVIPESGGFDPEEVFALIRSHHGVSFFAAPTMVRRLVSSSSARVADMRTLKTIVYGGGPMYLEDCKQALACFGNKLVQIYGQGESPMTITVLSKASHADTGHPRYDQRLSSVGISQAIVEVRISDSGDNAVPVGTVGEILVRGDSVMSGYWDDPEATAQTLRNGWLHTGDLGCLNNDGFLELKDRSKDVIISGGSNIYPREVEDVLLKHPAVAEVAVVGRRDPEWGEEVIAFIVPHKDQTVTEVELDSLCLEHIARFKRPKRYSFLEELPKNNYGKVLKTELRERS